MIYCPNCGRDVPLIAQKINPKTFNNILYYRCTQCEITFRKIHRGGTGPLISLSYEKEINLPENVTILLLGVELLGGA